jgi:uncharacterized peroxidase-related enzyme
MSRIKQIEMEEASSLARNLFGKVEQRLGVIPNMFRCMANSTMVFDGFMKMKASLGAGELEPRFQKLVTLATSEFNGCEYCVAANTKMSVDAGQLTDQECLDARRFLSQAPREAVLLTFVKRVLETKGQVSDDDLAALRDQGFGDEDVVEILAHIVITTMTNYMSSVGHPDLDFPEAPVL